MSGHKRATHNEGKIPMNKRFENKTGKGNVSAMRIEVVACPNSNAGAAHAKLVCELVGGSENTRAGKYFATLDEAQAQGEEWAALAIKSGLVAA